MSNLKLITFVFLVFLYSCNSETNYTQLYKVYPEVTPKKLLDSGFIKLHDDVIGFEKKINDTTYYFQFEDEVYSQGWNIRFSKRIESLEELEVIIVKLELYPLNQLSFSEDMVFTSAKWGGMYMGKVINKNNLYFTFLHSFGVE
ncbi:hypothetical protein N9L92_03075 [Saprospiraceae bacterium]|nr:hypothetical protein [Saprospiraceae bacterium]